MLHQRKIVVVMPAYRAEKTLARCHAAIPHDVVDEVLLVDDASGDGTVAVAHELGIAVSRHADNRGYGAKSQFNPLPFYQERHRQLIKIGMVNGVCGERSFGEYPESEHSLRLRHVAHLSALLRGKRYGADYLVMHRTPWTIVPGVPPTQWPDIDACLPRIAARLGAPIFSDDQIVVFALAPKPGP